MDYVATSTVKPLTKEETKILLSFIETSKIINNRTTNATTNKLKNEEWRSISDQFNATVTTCRRTPQQLRLKWENLKKNSRKRNTLIRMNSLKTGGGSADYIPPDDILDRVAALLGSTVDGFTVRFGGDAEPESTGVGSGDKALTPESFPVEKSSPSVDVQFNVIEVTEDTTVKDNGSDILITPKVKKVFFNTPRTSGFKRKLVKSDEHRAARNQAMAEYYTTKKKILDIKLENILLENKKLKMELEKLKNKD